MDRKSSVASILASALALMGLAAGVVGQSFPDRELQHVLSGKPKATNFGHVIALDGSRAVASDTYSQQIQRLHVLEWDGFAWTPVQTIDSIYSAESAYFGHALALRGDLLATSNPWTWVPATLGPGRGSVFVYGRDATSGQFQLDHGTILEPYMEPETWDAKGFGYSLCFLSDDMLAVGAPYGETHAGGSVGIYRLVPDHDLQQLLAPSDLAYGAAFGSAMVLEDGRLMVGAPFDTSPTGVPSQGTVRVFQEQAGLWVSQQTLTNADGGTGSNFGMYLAADGDWLVVSGGYEEVHLFRLQAGQYVEMQVIGSPAPIPEVEGFGHALALQGDLLLVGADQSDIGSMADAGRVFTYRLEGDTWLPASELTPSWRAASQFFGRALAAQPGCVLSGLPGGWVSNYFGAVEMYRLDAPGFGALGYALAGGSGNPVLQVLGTPQPQAPLEVRVGDAPPLAPMLVFAGADEALLPVKSGTLVPVPQIVFAGWVMNAQGHATLPLVWPADASGLSIVAQAWVADTAAPSGWSASNGVWLNGLP